MTTNSRKSRKLVEEVEKRLSGRYIDKRGWGEGPWQKEPDRVSFFHAGFECIALRHRNFGSWCGYVSIPRNHPWFLTDYQELEGIVEVHGGLTFSGRFQSESAEHLVGFDCNHGGDLAPGVEARLSLQSKPYGTYRTLGYVRQQLRRLAEQVRDATTGT